MVKRLLALAIVAVTMNLSADAILWMVDDDFYDGATYTAARVMVSPGDGGADQVLSVAYFDNGNWNYATTFPDGIGVIEDGSTGEMWSLVSADIDPTKAVFYIELGNYEWGDNYTLNWTSTVAIGEKRDYNFLRTNHSLGMGGSFDNVFVHWDGRPYVAAPEPSSGLLFLMGLSFLALRRKRERGGRR